MTVRTVSAAATSFLLREAGEGDGTPVLLLHGVPETSSCWRDVVPHLAHGRRVLAPDLPGLGGSTYGGPYDVPSLVGQLVALLEVEAPGRAVDVVGHDWGGSLALALAGARPDLVRRLVVANAPYRRLPVQAAHVPLFALPVLPEVLFRLGGRRAVDAMLALAWRAATPLDDERRSEYEAAYARPHNLAAMLGYYRAAARPRLVAALRRQRPEGTPRVRAEKTLVIWGALDPVLPVSTGEDVARDLGPDCVMVTVPGAGHFVVEEAPDVVADVLVDALADPPSPAAAPAPAPVDAAPAPLTAAATGKRAPAKAAPLKKAPAEATPAPKKAPAKKAPGKTAASGAAPPAKRAPAKRATPGQASASTPSPARRRPHQPPGASPSSAS